MNPTWPSLPARQFRLADSTLLQHRYAIDASKVEKELEWKAAETFETGIRKTVQWYLANRVWVDRVQSGAYRGERLGLAVAAAVR